ncbi:ATP synthase F1 subunit epsilon [Candidatus Pelagibacter bacterium]|nr:ATP synthase F1 subunit epsilon [Candidatus Pelagibacter bacterium]
MSENFAVEIISPNQSILKTETEEVTLPSFEGEMGILKDHVSLITFLRPGIITIKKDNNETKFFVEEGTVEFSKNNLLILTSTAKNLAQLKKNDVNDLIKSSQEKIEQKDISDKERYLLSHKIDVLKREN